MIEKLTISDNKIDKKPAGQRALVLQGGGALGAYELGVIKTLCKRLIQKDKKNSKDNNKDICPLFDIVTGTSIGAINASILVGNVVHQRNYNPKFTSEQIWKVAIDELEKFWKVGLVADVLPLDGTEMWKPWSEEDGWYKKIKTIASKEAARRYYATKVFVFGGKKVFSTKEIRPDLKFFDPDNKRLVLNEIPLMKKLEEFGKFPIATSFENAEPRLLVTAVDLEEGITVTFDSYKKADGTRKSEYYPDSKYGYTKESKNKRGDSAPIVITYEDGIDIEHVMASSTLPELYDPKEISNRRFWDGGLLSNTPLRELLESHRDYWINVEEQDQIPDLEVYIINVHPSRINAYDKNKNNNYDFVKDRSNDIVYGDRTYNEQLSSAIMNDFLAFINDLKKHALGHIKKDGDKKAFERDFEKLKNKKAENVSINYGQDTNYEDLMKRVFKLTKVVRVERKYDTNSSTSLKTGDLTPKTIDELIKEGEEDAKSI